MDRLKVWLAVSGGVLLLFLGACTKESAEKRAEVIKPPVVAPGATYVGSETCLECHEDFAADARINVHLRLADFEAPGYAKGCEGCHGPGSRHVEAMQEDETEAGLKAIIRFGEEGFEGEEASAVCMTCHAGGETMHFAFSAHFENDVACSDCHKVHGNKREALLAKSELDLCASCHRDVAARLYFPSRHPVKEGHMLCSDCHNAHGTGNPVPGMIRTEERLNDLCLKCHTRYQGPFVFEHEPVVEDCTICHDPHGTVANNLLKQNEPFLCMQCHEIHFHATRLADTQNSINPTDSSGEPPGQVGNFTSSSPHAWARAFLTKCTQCHQQIHGSDFPSQSIPGQGRMLTR